jgi:glycosyltransferase involved in cell wall biosynthesis
MLRVSIIVPAYNEQDTILPLLREVRAQRLDGVQFEVIVVDDGSRDQTPVLLAAHPDLYDRLITQPVNGGKGKAVQAALRAATGAYVLMQDADLEYSPTEYANLLFPVMAFGAEVVMGSRFVAPRYTRVQYFTHKLGNGLLTLFFNVLFNTTFTDIYSCYLLFRRELLNADELLSHSWEQHAEILCRVSRRAKVIYEVPISYHGRSYEEGKKIRARHMIPVVGMILRRRLFG